MNERRQILQPNVQVWNYCAERQNQHGNMCGFALTQRMTLSWKAGAQIGLILIISVQQPPAYRCRPEQIWWMDQSAGMDTADTWLCVYTHHGLHNYYSSCAHRQRAGLEKRASRICRKLATRIPGECLFCTTAVHTGLHTYICYNARSAHGGRHLHISHLQHTSPAPASATLIKYAPQLWKTPGACNLLSVAQCIRSKWSCVTFFGCDWRCCCCNFIIHLPILLHVHYVHGCISKSLALNSQLQFEASS